MTRGHRQGRRFDVLIAGSLVAVVSVGLSSQGSRTVQDGVFSEPQAARGQALYGQQCATCHGDTLQGAQAPA